MLYKEVIVGLQNYKRDIIAKQSSKVVYFNIIEQIENTWVENESLLKEEQNRKEVVLIIFFVLAYVISLRLLNNNTFTAVFEDFRKVKINKIGNWF